MTPAALRRSKYGRRFKLIIVLIITNYHHYYYDDGNADVRIQHVVRTSFVAAMVSASQHVSDVTETTTVKTPLTNSTALVRISVVAFRCSYRPMFAVCHKIILRFIVKMITAIMGFAEVVFFIAIAANCSSTDFRCADGVQCIRPCARCDGVSDCSDSSDELNCCEFCSHFSQ